MTFTGPSSLVAGTGGAQNVVTDGGENLLFSRTDGLFLQLGTRPAVRVVTGDQVPAAVALFGRCVLLVYEEPGAGSLFRAVRRSGAPIGPEVNLAPETAGRLIQGVTAGPILTTISGDRRHLLGRRIDSGCSLGAPFDFLAAPAGAEIVAHAEDLSPLTGEIGVASVVAHGGESEVRFSRSSADAQLLAGPAPLNPPGIHHAEAPAISYDPLGNAGISFFTSNPAAGTAEYLTFEPVSGPPSTSVLFGDGSGQVTFAEPHSLGIAPGLYVMAANLTAPSAFHLFTSAVAGAQLIGSGFAVFVDPNGDSWPGQGFTIFPVPRRLGQDLEVLSVLRKDFVGPSGTALSGVYRRPFIVPAPCVADDTTLCLHAGRFRVNVSELAPGRAAGYGHAVGLTDNSGYFWFFGATNVEVLVKVIDGCGLNGSFWVFAAGFTNVKTIVSVTDSPTGASRSYLNPPETAFQPVQDTAAFNCSPLGH
jgi:hypothetical protein